MRALLAAALAIALALSCPCSFARAEAAMAASAGDASAGAASAGDVSAGDVSAMAAAPPAAFALEAAPPFVPGPEFQALSIAALPIRPPVLATRVSGNGTPHSGPGPLNAERARVMLQSLTVPGWGQVTTGHPRAATTFYLIETGIWVSFAAFEMQESMRMQSSIRTAQLYAGIDLHGRSDEYRRIVGEFPNSDEYNRLVVYRDAANLYYNDPAAYRAYIAAHEVSGSNAWSWVDPDSYARYSAQRKSSQKAGLRANTALALALANRLISAIHAAGASGHMKPAHSSVRLELTPDFAQMPPAMRLGLSATY
jgi:hypothetical protein